MRSARRQRNVSWLCAVFASVSSEYVEASRVSSAMPFNSPAQRARAQLSFKSNSSRRYISGLPGQSLRNMTARPRVHPVSRHLRWDIRFIYDFPAIGTQRSTPLPDRLLSLSIGPLIPNEVVSVVDVVVKPRSREAQDRTRHPTCNREWSSRCSIPRASTVTTRVFKPGQYLEKQTRVAVVDHGGGAGLRYCFGLSNVRGGFQRHRGNIVARGKV